MEPAIRLQEEAGRSAWEEVFCSQHLSVISGGRAVVSQRLEAAADELRRGGEGAAFAAELLAGESGESEESLGGGIGRVRDRSRPNGAVRGSAGVFFQKLFRGFWVHHRGRGLILRAKRQPMSARRKVEARPDFVFSFPAGCSTTKRRERLSRSLFCAPGPTPHPPPPPRFLSSSTGPSVRGRKKRCWQNGHRPRDEHRGRQGAAVGPAPFLLDGKLYRGVFGSRARPKRHRETSAVHACQRRQAAHDTRARQLTGRDAVGEMRRGRIHWPYQCNSLSGVAVSLPRHLLPFT